MKNSLTVFFIFFSILILAGCSSTDVSKNSGFSSYVGHELPLQSAAAIVKKDSNSGVYYDGIHSKFILINDDTPEWGFVDKTVVRLPTNHIVFLDKARVEFRGDLERTVAYGRTILPNSTNQINFAYLWGTDFQVQRAPWEPLSVRPVRWLTGDRPAHWDYPMFNAPTNQP
ncbi:MAG TPA: hypothetical protein VK810_04055 [Dongiaceae bacterium]|jgi:hypothetical protein|nr:hypothetical protein [Dongiaceae bacterium]